MPVPVIAASLRPSFFCSTAAPVPVVTTASSWTADWLSAKSARAVWPGDTATVCDAEAKPTARTRTWG